MFSAAPIPVVTPQPISAAASNGTSLSIRTTPLSCRSICSANPPMCSNCTTGSPFSESRDGSSGERAGRSMQRNVSPVRHRSQRPQKADRQAMT